MKASKKREKVTGYLENNSKIARDNGNFSMRTPTETPTPTPTKEPQPTLTPTPTQTQTPSPTSIQPTTTPNPSPNPTLTPTWQIPNTTITQQYEGGLFSSLVLDSSGNPHVSYEDSLHESLRYATYKGTSWNSELVDARTFNYFDGLVATAASVGQYSSLALDSKGYPHISYYDYTSFLVRVTSILTFLWYLVT